jgi:hypothetical protein
MTSCGVFVGGAFQARLTGDPKRVALLLLMATACLMSISLSAQRGGGGQTARGAAPVDLTGYWVTVVTEDWRYRMVTPARGDHPSVPLNTAGNAFANSWDAAKDEAAGEQCRAYGAAGVMRAPGRIRVTWQDDTTLKIETEAGTQTRQLRFGAPESGDGAGWQGQSVATWEFAGAARGRGAVATPGPRAGHLKVVTTRMRPGYLQKNGVPYSANAVLTEYFSRTIEPNGDSWLILTSIVDDPQYLTGPFIRSTHFKRLPDTNTIWEPEACSSR